MEFLRESWYYLTSLWTGKPSEDFDCSFMRKRAFCILKVLFLYTSCSDLNNILTVMWTSKLPPLHKYKLVGKLQKSAIFYLTLLAG